jgi:hypothetical protein
MAKPLCRREGQNNSKSFTSLIFIQNHALLDSRRGHHHA